MPTTEVVLLLDDNEVKQALKLTAEDLQWFVSTGQLLPIFLNGKRRFTLLSLQELITTYQNRQQRS